MTSEAYPTRWDVPRITGRTYLAGLRHELITPICQIVGYAEMLQEEAKEHGLEAFVSDLGQIHAAGQQVLAMVDGVLEPEKFTPTNPGISRIRHEIRIPLNSIIGYSEMLAEQAAEDGPKGCGPYLDKIRSAALSLLAVVTGGARIVWPGNFAGT